MQSIVLDVLAYARDTGMTLRRVRSSLTLVERVHVNVLEVRMSVYVLMSMASGMHSSCLTCVKTARAARQPGTCCLSRVARHDGSSMLACDGACGGSYQWRAGWLTFLVISTRDAWSWVRFIHDPSWTRTVVAVMRNLRE